MQRVCSICGQSLTHNQQSQIDPRIQQGCRDIIRDLKEDMRILAGYRIPPQFFGHAAKQATRSFGEDYFSIVDFESINYIIDMPNKQALFNGIDLFKREKPLQILDKEYRNTQ